MQYWELCLDSEQDISASSIYLDVSIHAHTPVGSSGMFMSLRETKHIPSWVVQENVNSGCRAGMLHLILPSSNPYLPSRGDKFQWIDKLALTWHITGEARVPGRCADLRRWPCASRLHAKTCWCSNIIRQVSVLLLLRTKNGLIYYHNIAVFLIKVTKNLSSKNSCYKYNSHLRKR